MVRFVAGAVALLAVVLVRRERPRIGRANLWLALWLGVHAVAISFGYLHIGAAAGPAVTGAGLVWAALMGAVTTALSYVAWYACQRRMPATTAGSVQLVIPILTAAGAMVLLGEQLTLLFVVAALLVFAGLWVGRPR